MEEKAKKNAFSDSAVFRSMPSEKLAEIAQVTETRVIAPKTLLFRQGDPGDSFYIIRSGKVRVFRRGADGVETDLSVLHAGDSFGEMALITGEPRSANVETIEETQLTILSKEDFDRILRDYPLVSLNLVKQISHWLLEDEKKLEQEVRQRMAPPPLSWIDFLFIIVISSVFALVFNQSNPNSMSLFPSIPNNEAIGNVTIAEAFQDHQKGETLFIDAMPSNFYDEKHIKGAVNMPMVLFDIMYTMALDNVEKSRKIIVYGRTISRIYDAEVANKLALRGHKNVKILQSGLSAWKKMGYPVEP